MSVIGIFSPRCCSFLIGNSFKVSGRNMPSSPRAGAGIKLTKNSKERKSAATREYFDVMNFPLARIKLSWAMLPDEDEFRKIREENTASVDYRSINCSLGSTLSENS